MQDSSKTGRGDVVHKAERVYNSSAWKCQGSQTTRFDNTYVLKDHKLLF